jgi:hypothetical protein
MKNCTKCKEKKPLTEYTKDKYKKDGFRTVCKVCTRHSQKKYYQKYSKKIIAWQKKYFQNNEEKVRAQQKKYYQNNTDKICARQKKYYENNTEKIRAYHNKYREIINDRKRKYNRRPNVKEKKNKQIKERYRTDVNFRLVRTLRTRLSNALNGKSKSAKTLELLGCSVDHLKKHLENQFYPGMTWEDRYDWHIDHIVPCNSFDLTDPYEQQQCFHYSNLQPLWKAENLSKKDKELYHRTWIGTQWVGSHRSALTTLRSVTSLS